MYTSIPMQELRHYKDSTLEINGLDKTIRRELLTLHAIKNQKKIFSYSNKIHQQY